MTRGAEAMSTGTAGGAAAPATGWSSITSCRFALGGAAVVSNLRVRCRAHHRLRHAQRHARRAGVPTEAPRAPVPWAEGKTISPSAPGSIASKVRRSATLGLTIAAVPRPAQKKLLISWIWG